MLRKIGVLSIALVMATLGCNGSKNSNGTRSTASTAPRSSGTTTPGSTTGTGTTGTSGTTGTGTTGTGTTGTGTAGTGTTATGTTGTGTTGTGMTGTGMTGTGMTGTGTGGTGGSGTPSTGTGTPGPAGAPNVVGSWTGNWVETNNASGSTWGAGSGSMIADLKQSATGQITGTLTMYGVASNLNYLDFTITSGSIDSKGNIQFQATDEPYRVNLITFWGPVTNTGGKLKLDGQYTMDGGPFVRNADYFLPMRC